MQEILTEFIVKLLGWAVPSAIRWRYPSTRLNELVKVRVSSQGEGIEFWNGDIPKVKAWVEIANFSPFPIEIERAYGSFAYGASLENFTYLKREVIPPATETAILIEASITNEHVAVIGRLASSHPTPAIQFNARILCKVQDFELSRHVQTSHHRLVNFNVPG